MQFYQIFQEIFHGSTDVSSCNRSKKKGLYANRIGTWSFSTQWRPQLATKWPEMAVKLVIVIVIRFYSEYSYIHFTMIHQAIQRCTFNWEAFPEGQSALLNLCTSIHLYKLRNGVKLSSTGRCDIFFPIFTIPTIILLNFTKYLFLF